MEMFEEDGAELVVNVMEDILLRHSRRLIPRLDRWQVQFYAAYDGIDVLV